MARYEKMDEEEQDESAIKKTKEWIKNLW